MYFSVICPKNLTDFLERKANDNVHATGQVKVKSTKSTGG